MGYMTVVSILNDAWNTIKENPEQFIKNIEEGMHSYHGPSINHYPVDNYANPMEVHRAFHANLTHVLVVGGNHMEDLTELNPRRVNDDFYLAYKMRTVHCVENMAKSSKTEILHSAADMIVADMKRCGKDISQIKEVAQNLGIWKVMEDDERNWLVFLVGAKLAKE